MVVTRSTLNTNYKSPDEAEEEEEEPIHPEVSTSIPGVLPSIQKVHHTETEQSKVCVWLNPGQDHCYIMPLPFRALTAEQLLSWCWQEQEEREAVDQR